MLRYMGWVEKNKVENNEGVKGIIIVKEIDNKSIYLCEKCKFKLEKVREKNNF